MSSKKILILGGKGRLAASLASHWAVNHHVETLARPELDVQDLDALQRELEKRSFDILINGTGLTNVDRCEKDRDEARQINALAPGVMAKAASQQGARFIHFSTDYVFDGKKPEPYLESDAANPLGYYGASKLEGEQIVLAENSHHLVVRVSWVFGPAKPSFVDLVIQRACKETSVEAIADKFSSPTLADDVALWMEPFFEKSLPGGLYHACNSGSCSWQEYGAYALQCAAEAGVPLLTTTVNAIHLADMKQFIAPRPVFSILSTCKLTEATGIAPRHWHDALRDYIFKKYAPISSPS